MNINKFVDLSIFITRNDIKWEITCARNEKGGKLWSSVNFESKCSQAFMLGQLSDVVMNELIFTPIRSNAF